MAEDRPELRVGAHVLVQLGSELVTDAEQAILECVKNAYDADSPGCRIVIDTRERGVRIETGRAGDLSRFLRQSETVRAYLHDARGNPIVATNQVNPDDRVQRHLHYVGRISIEDAGDGLTQSQLRDTWLVISQSKKRKEEGPKTKTRRGRTPLGDKGLGRLGSMKLGDILLIETAPARTAPIATAQFRWTDCETAKTVDEIPVFLKQQANDRSFKGSVVSVLGLRDITEWRRKDRVNEITRSLARLISPFEATSTFPVGIVLDGVEHSLVTVTDELLSRAVAEFKFRWGPARPGGTNVLTATARIRKRLLTSTRSKVQRERTNRVFKRDGGKGFVEWLPTYKRITSFKGNIDPDGPWFVELERVYDWDELQSDAGSQVCDPGPFEGAFYFFHLLREEDIEQAASGFQFDPALVKDMSGISILRDGFRVRSQGDWLQLSSGMTSGSTYNMRPENTIGYFALSGEWNYALVEKSDREGFVEDANYRGFELIATACRDFANEALVVVRRAVDEYSRKLAAEVVGAPETAEDSIKALEANFDAIEDARGKAQLALASLGEALEDLETDPAAASEPSAVASRAMTLATSAVSAIQQVAHGLEVNISPKLLTQKINRELEDRHEQLAALYESAAVGLSARGLAHELRTHLTEIRKRTDIIEKVANAREKSVSLGPHFRAIKSSCAAISQAAALIDPMLPKARTIKETFSLREFVESYFKGRSAAYHKAEIKPEVSGRDVTIRANRPRLLQVLDNLARNSVFWMSRGSRFTGGKEKRISVDLTGDGFILSDTGPGVNPRYEESLFEIFVSGKGQKDRGQGLGLYITTQLLEIDGCSISLLPDRNEFGRRYRFQVDLAALIEGA